MERILRRVFLGGMLACQAGLSMDRPNIVIILADDLGYADLGVQGCEDIPTPHIDSIARNGIRFTNGYANHAVCSPSRAALMTGRYQHRFGFENNSGPERYAAPNFGVPRTEKLISERLKDAGYATGMMGKWHIGFKEGLRPWERGYDTTYVFLSGARSFWPPKDERNPTYRNGIIVEDETDYLTDAFARESESFIDANKDKPFFLYLSFNAVHAPLESPDSIQARFPHIKDANRKIYAGMLSSMDDAVGRVLSRLEQHGLVENTLLFFMSDNGGPTSQTTSRNDPLRGFKGTRWEGGIRVPALAQWPAVLPKGKVYDDMIMGFDLTATSLAAAGLPMPEDKPMDGVDLVPFLTGKKKGKPHDQLFWRSGESNYAARVGDWKVVGSRTDGIELFNLKDDISETTNLAKSHPEVLQKIQNAYAGWSSQMMDPKWIRQDASNAEIGGRLKGVQDVSQQRGQNPIRRRFEEADIDGDGRLSPEEFRNAETFKLIDSDNDGFATLEEVRAYYQGRRESQPSGNQSRVGTEPDSVNLAATAPGISLTPLANALRTAPPPIPHKEEIVDQRAGEPPLKRMPPGDAARDAGGRGQLFESISVPGFTDFQKGLNGFALADMNRDGRLDIVASYSPARGNTRKGETDELRVLLNRGGFFLNPAG